MSGFLVTVYRGRTKAFTVDLYQADGATVVNLAAGDVVRVKIGRGDAVPDLDLDSSENAAGGSTVAVVVGDNTVTVTLDQDDTALLDAGVYDCEVSVVDDSDGARIKCAEYGTLAVLTAMAGNLGEEQSSS